MNRHHRLWAPLRHLARLRRDERGVVVVLMTLVMGVIFGFVGLAADASAWYTIQMRMQTAADAGALNAALTYFGGGGNLQAAQAAAELDAGRNGFVHEVDGVEVEAALIESRIRVTITGPGGLFTFSRLFNDDPATIVAAAEAGRVVDGLLCLLTLGGSNNGGDASLFLDSNSVVNAPGCDIHVNSAGNPALHIKSNSSIQANDICVVGTAKDESTGSFTPAPDTGCSEMADPLADIPAPTVGPCGFNNAKYDSVTRTLNPGVYCGGLEILGNANVTLNPGTYIISGGKGLFVDSNSTVTGNGVTFYLTNSAVVQFLSNTRFSLSAPQQGATTGIPGILFFEDRNNPTGLTHRIDSNSSLQILDGAFYFSKNTLRIDSNSTLSSQSSCMIMIARHIRFDSNAINLMTNFDQCANLVPGELFESTITLIA
jgi:hypothetical protein